MMFLDLVVVAAHVTLTTLGRLTFRHESGLSYIVLGPFHPPVQSQLLFSSMMLCMSLVGLPAMEPS
jgi:hypothetical protein